MRITDIALSTPVAGARPAPARRSGAESSGAVLVPSGGRDVAHPDEVAAGALARAASHAHASRVVAAANEHAAASVRGDRLDEVLVP